MDIVNYILLGIVLIVSIWLHEYAHARSANKLGDPTPRLQWRLTPNPLMHIDPIGFIMIFLIGFGWWKPVYTNPAYFRHPVRDDFLVAMAGPISNILMSIIGMIIIGIYSLMIGISSPVEIFATTDIVIKFWVLFSMVNIGLAVFNLIPIFPLDGYRIIKIISPRAGYWMEKNGQIMTIIALVLILWLGRNIIGTYISHVSEAIFNFFFIVMSQIFF